MSEDCPATCTRCAAPLLPGGSVLVVAVDYAHVDPRAHHGFRIGRANGLRPERHWLCQGCEPNVLLIGTR